MRRVLKWSLEADDRVQVVGGGTVVHVASQSSPTRVEVWTEESGDGLPRRVRIFGTGHEIPDGLTHLGSALAGPFVWHVYEVTA